MTLDLFDRPLIEGLDYRPDLLTDAEHEALLARVTALDLPPFLFQAWEGKRRTQSFGWRYDFNNGAFELADPLPHWLLPVRDKAASVAAVPPEDFVHALIARYDPGAGIGWHRDRPVFDTVGGISLGSPATLRFRQRTPTGFLRARVHLDPRSCYILSGPARHEWEHSIAPGTAQRFSITFRTLSQLGYAKAAKALEL